MERHINERWRDATLELIAPRACFSCGNRLRNNDLLCLLCEVQLQECMLPECELPGLTPDGRRVVAAFYYRRGSPIRSLHRAAKYEGNIRAATRLGQFLSDQLNRLEAAKNLPSTLDSCVSLPSHRAKILDRGLDSTKIIASQVADGLGLPYSERLITRIRLSASQSEVTGEERRENVRGVFRCATGNPKRVLLIDDVVTTGGTLDEAARALETAGHRVTLAAVAFRREMFSRPSYK